MTSQIATEMRWHKDRKIEDGQLRHPADSITWKTLDSKYPSFAADPRNVRLGLASDGFNPFGIMSSSNSIWPIVLVPYNLPQGVVTYDASTKETFRLYASILWTVNDFAAYGNLS